MLGTSSRRARSLDFASVVSETDVVADRHVTFDTQGLAGELKPSARYAADKRSAINVLTREQAHVILAATWKKPREM